MMSAVDLDPVIHSPNRLQICALLSPLERAEFRVLREELGVSDSVLSKHLSELESAGYVRLRKDVVGGRRRTWASLTAAGRQAFASHVRALQHLVSVSERSAG
jgi:DNA-binding MarR family transcriptional regulator